MQLDIFIVGFTSVPVLAVSSALNVFLWVLIIIETAVVHISAPLGLIWGQIRLNYAAFKHSFIQIDINAADSRHPSAVFSRG